MRRSRPCAELEVASQIAPSTSGAKILPRVIVTSFPASRLGTSGVDCIPSQRRPPAVDLGAREQGTHKAPRLAAAPGLCSRHARHAQRRDGARPPAFGPTRIPLTPPPASPGRKQVSQQLGTQRGARDGLLVSRRTWAPQPHVLERCSPGWPRRLFRCVPAVRVAGAPSRVGVQSRAYRMHGLHPAVMDPDKWKEAAW
jgi:hypothetical protein